MSQKTIDVESKLFSRMKLDGDCWIWTGAVDGKNYGMMRVCGPSKKTHRLSFEIFKGEIPKGKIVMHSCDNPPCFNPEHLSVGTHQDNADDKMRKKRHWVFKKTHCKHGHELLSENVYLRKSDNSRCCLVCNRIRLKKRYRGRGF